MEGSNELAQGLADADEAARRIKAARGYAELTREQLAERVSLSARQIKLIEDRQRHSTTRDELLEIARACNVPDEFMDLGWQGADQVYDSMVMLVAVAISQEPALLLAAAERLGIDPARLSLGNSADATTPPAEARSGRSSGGAAREVGRPVAAGRPRSARRTYEDR